MNAQVEALREVVFEAIRIIQLLDDRTLDTGDGETVDLLQVIERWDEVLDSVDEASKAVPAVAIPMDNDELLRAWRRKVLGVEPSQKEMTAFALGVEAGAEQCHPPVMLTRLSCSGMCEVSIEVQGKWIPVIRDNGDTISHIVEPLGIRSAIAKAGGAS